MLKYNEGQNIPRYSNSTNDRIKNETCDAVVCAPSSDSLQKLLMIYVQFAIANNIAYNVKGAQASNSSFSI